MLRAILAAAALASAASPAFAAADQASHTFELRGVVPVVCRADFQSAVQEQADGVIQLGSTQEFCNAGQGYNVIVDYAAGQDAGALIVDGREVALNGSGSAVIAAVSGPARQGRQIAYRPGDTRLSSLRIRVQANFA